MQTSGGGNYLFSLQPTFTQGLVLGQLSILFLLSLILKYLFLDAARPLPHLGAQKPLSLPVPVARTTGRAGAKGGEDGGGYEDGNGFAGVGAGSGAGAPESAEWMNAVLQQVADAYRAKLRGDLGGAAGDEAARARVEAFANRVRPVGFLDEIRIHAVDVGVSAPRLANARLARARPSDGAVCEHEVEFDMTYTDTISVSLSTAYLFNYPLPSFARLPVSVTISLSLFSSSIVMTPPSATAPAPTLAVRIPPSFRLELKTTSLMGSRAKLADVPKLHELIEHQLRRQLAQRGSWKIVLPGLTSVADVQAEMKAEGALP